MPSTTRSNTADPLASVAVTVTPATDVIRITWVPALNRTSMARAAPALTVGPTMSGDPADPEFRSARKLPPFRKAVAHGSVLASALAVTKLSSVLMLLPVARVLGLNTISAV